MSTGNETMSPPVAMRRETVDTTHGERRVDDYAWLREKENPEVAAYLEAENAYTASVLAPTVALQETLYAEMLSRIKETDDTPPHRYAGWLWYSRTEEGKQYPILCRKRDANSAEQITLDVNALAEGKPFMALGTYGASPDGRLLAYSTDSTGFRQFTLQVKDLESGELLPERIERSGSVAWASDGRTLFYTVEDDATKRQYQLYRHRVGEMQDDLVYEEPDERFNIDVHRSRSGAYVFLSIASHTTSEVRFIPAGDPSSEWRTIAPREHEHEYDVDHQGNWLYIATNDRGRNFRLVRAPVADPGREHWEEVLPHRDDVMLEGLLAFEGHIALFERERGLQQIAMQDLASGTWHRMAFDEPVYSLGAQANREYETPRLRFAYQSLVTPNSVFEYDMETRQRELLKRTEVPGGYDASQYTSVRIWVDARDGTPVPVSLVYRKSTPLDGSAAMHLTGYGSYGYPYPVEFSSNRVSLMDRGVVCAIAHIRGGGEMGKRWHDEGKMASKMNTFTDFIDVADGLIARGYTSSDRLVIEGASAGGLLMGAVTNLRPELFRGVISKVPFVDVLNTMLDATLPLTVAEYEEWGNPNIADEYAVMRAYCPYTNLEAKDYPTLLVKTSFNDSQVMYWEPAKYVAKLRALLRTLKTDARPLLLKTNMAAGHGGASGRYDYLREIAVEYAFVVWVVGAAQAG
ncbi:MAG TPA: S9 family peptidase [Dehalococcoidia bacterium]